MFLIAVARPSNTRSARSSNGLSGCVFDAWPGEGACEFTLTALAYNLRRVINIVEFPQVMTASSSSSVHDTSSVQCAHADLCGCRRASEHRAKSVARFVAAQAGKLALFFLPPYSPELNPDEFVWNDLKNHGTWRKLITSFARPRRTVVSYMRQLQKLPDLVAVSFLPQLRDMHAPNGIYSGRLIMMHLSLLRLANRSRPTSSQ